MAVSPPSPTMSSADTIVLSAVLALALIAAGSTGAVSMASSAASSVSPVMVTPSLVEVDSGGAAVGLKRAEKVGVSYI